VHHIYIYPAGYYLKTTRKNAKHIALPYYMSSLKVKEEVRTQCLFFCYRDIWSERYIILSSLLPFPVGEELLLRGNPQSSNRQSNHLPVLTFRKMIPVFWHRKKFTQKNSQSFFFKHVPSAVPLTSPDVTIKV